MIGSVRVIRWGWVSSLLRYDGSKHNNIRPVTTCRDTASDEHNCQTFGVKLSRTSVVPSNGASVRPGAAGGAGLGSRAHACMVWPYVVLGGQEEGGEEGTQKIRNPSELIERV